MAEWGGYNPNEERAQQKLAATCIYGGSIAVAGASTVALLWKLGVIPALLPEPLRKPIDRLVARMAKVTEPPNVTKLDGSAAKHLSTVYTKVALNFGVSFLGVAAFFRFPYVPLPLAVGTAAVPALLVTGLPKSHINPVSRTMLTLVSAFACGYSFGPINWVAYDSTIYAGVSVLASAVGFTTASIITRGKISFFLLSQVLSGSLAVIGSHQVLHTTGNFQTSSSRARAGQAVANVNGILLIQVLSNIAVAALHALPVLMKFERRADAHRRFKQENNIPHDMEVERPGDEELDPEKEALLIFGAACYALWTWFRYVSSAVVLKVTGRERRKTQNGTIAVPAAMMSQRLTAETLQEAALMHERISKISDFAASLVFLYFYVRVVGYFQSSANVRQAFDSARNTFARVSPVLLVA
jgi:hypothetical protein